MDNYRRVRAEGGIELYRIEQDDCGLTRPYYIPLVDLFILMIDLFLLIITRLSFIVKAINMNFLKD